MKQETINGIRVYYQLSEDITDEHIRNNLKGSLGEACVNITLAKENLAEAFRNSGFSANNIIKAFKKINRKRI